MSLIRTFNIPISYQDISGFAVDEHGMSVAIPERSIVVQVDILRRTAWDVIGSFQLGILSDPDLLVKSFQAGLTESAPGVNTVEVSEYFAGLTGIYATWNQGAATQGEGNVVLKYIMLR